MLNCHDVLSLPTLSVTLGCVEPATTYRHLLARVCLVGTHANQHLEKIPTSRERTDFLLVLPTLNQIGVKGGDPFGLVTENADRLGLSPCPVEVAPAFCCSYPKKGFDGRVIRVVPERPFADQGMGAETIFMIYRDLTGLWLHTDCIVDGKLPSWAKDEDLLAFGAPIALSRALAG